MLGMLELLGRFKLSLDLNLILVQDGGLDNIACSWSKLKYLR